MKLFFKQVYVFLGLKVKEFLEYDWKDIGQVILFIFGLCIFCCLGWFVLTCIGLLHTYIHTGILDQMVDNSSMILTHFFTIGFLDIVVVGIILGISYGLGNFLFFLRRNWIEAGRIVRGE